MPSKKIHKNTETSAARLAQSQVVFLPLLGLALVLWILYRAIFQFPIWFDETIGKAIFFGLPVWIYVSITQDQSILETFSIHKVNKGLLLGLALGGIYGFAGALMGVLQASGGVQAVDLFMTTRFWWEFFLALMTSFWETLFFFSWIMTLVQQKFIKRNLWLQVVITAVIFMLFHIPNSILRFDTAFLISSQIILLFFFALGQAFIFSRWKNFYTLVISQTIWGMVLLVHLI